MMKKAVLGAAVLLAFVGTAEAATVVGFKAGVDYWHADTEGSFAERSQPQQTFDYDSSGQVSYWVNIEHPLPLIPNIKIRKNSLKEDGRLASADFNFDGYHFNGDTQVDMDLSSTDFVLYYEVLDNDIVELDLGGAYKLMQGSVRVTDATRAEEKDIDDGIVMGYGAVEVGVPFLSLYGFAEAYLGMDESDVHDYTLGLGWEYDGLTADYKVRVGYREFQFDVTGFSGINADVAVDGYFVGVEVDF